MDLYAKKILGFLQANPNLDLETADIAFHLKLDEHFVQNYMSSLLRQGVVINRKNEYGRVYWFAHNPETEFAVMEPLSAPLLSNKMETVKQVDEFDEFLEKKERKLPVLKILFIIALTAAFGALGYLTVESINGKINQVSNSTKNLAKEMVVKTEYENSKNDFSSQMLKMESEIQSLKTMVDSLKTSIARAEKQQQTAIIKVPKTRKKHK